MRLFLDCKHVRPASGQLFCLRTFKKHGHKRGAVGVADLGDHGAACSHTVASPISATKVTTSH